MVKQLGEDIDIIETSAKDNSNVNSAFMMLARKALKRQLILQKKADEKSSTKRALEREKQKHLGRSSSFN